MRNTEEIWRLVDERGERYAAFSDRIWGMPELAYAEHRSCAEHTAMLEGEGFRVTEDVAGIPTAVMGEAGEGGPVIAILGEYDALPGLSPGGRRRRAAPAAGRRRRPWLRPQPARRRLAARRGGGEGLARGERHAGPRPLLRLPGRGGRRRQGLHGARRRLRRRRHRHLLAPRRLLRRERAALARQHPHRLRLPRPRLPRRRRAASRPQRARRGRADECRRELHARAHAERRARPLRLSRRRRHRAQRRAGHRARCATSSAPATCPSCGA